MTEDSTKGPDTSIIIGDGGAEGKVEDSIVKNGGITWNSLKSADSLSGQGRSDHGGDGNSHGGSSFGSEGRQTNSSGLSNFEKESDVSPCATLKRHPYSVKKAMLAY
eukprot:scaffold250458_cov30-Tisochrysis_lutea.AAC.1